MWSAALLVLFTLGVAVTDAYVFSRNLSLGDSNIDVIELQKVLNSNPQTQVAQFGPGSPGQETEYFGVLTRRAVIAFQNMYREQVLSPVGLTVGTGFVGPSTRVLLSALSEVRGNTSSVIDELGAIADDALQGTTNSMIGSLDSAFGDASDIDELILAYPSAYEGDVGDTLTLYGFGFENENKVYFDNELVGEFSAQDTTQITFTVPNLPYQKYDVSIENSKGRTDTDMFFVVKDPRTPSPVIRSITPKRGVYADEVTLTGTGFDAGNLEVRTSYEVLDRVSASGNSISFAVEPFPDTPGAEAGVSIPGEDVEWEIALTVINDNGVSNQVTFTLEL